MFTGRERNPSHRASASGDRGILHSLSLGRRYWWKGAGAPFHAGFSGCPATAIAVSSASRRLLPTFAFCFALCLFLRLRVDLLS